MLGLLRWLRESVCNAGDIKDVDLILGLGRSPGVGNGNLLQYSFLENSIDRVARWAGYSPWGHKELVRHDLATKQ